ncbi:MAG: hypothetical protein EOQ87_31615 [Mesorhizobium sp.]|nr:MAG: hypothetical protein EOQ87_31615 [Mesorhizobium sp.]
MAKTQINKLVEVLAKAEYAVEMADQAKDSIHHPGGLWYHAIGMFNAYYAITQELLNRTKNGNDAELRAAVDAWWNANRATANAFFHHERNVATHSGEIDVEYFTEWELDDWHDTDRPVRSAQVSVKGSRIQEMPATEFLELSRKALTFVRDGILAIDADYKARGGKTHALPAPEDIRAALDEVTL